MSKTKSVEQLRVLCQKSERRCHRLLHGVTSTCSATYRKAYKLLESQRRRLRAARAEFYGWK